MALDNILAAIDEQIRNLQQARTLLADLPNDLVGRGPGRPKGSTGKSKPRKRRALSAEGRAKIAAAQKKRWAAIKKAKS